MKHRSDRLEDLIQEELGKILQREFEFVGTLVTITSVQVEGKLEGAKVKVGIIPTSERDRVMAALKEKQGYCQHLLNRTLNIRPMPRIEFVFDEGAENAAHVEKLLMEKDAL